MSHQHWPVSRIATEIPGASAVLFYHNINFCCRGHRPLDEVIKEQALDATPLLTALMELVQRANSHSDWHSLSTEELIAHILSRYHAVHREQLPELIRLAARVESVHDENPLCPRGLSEHLEMVQANLEQHMHKEEAILFPMLSNGRGATALGPIRVMEADHEDHLRNIQRINELAHELNLHSEACNTWQALYRGLQAFVSDISQHIHLENNVLFARFTQPGQEEQRHG